MKKRRSDFRKKRVNNQEARRKRIKRRAIASATRRENKAKRDAEKKDS